MSLHHSPGAQGIFWSCQFGVCIARGVEKTHAVFTRTPAATYSGFSVLSENGGLRRPKTPTGAICLRAQSKTFPNGLLRTGMSLWMGLTSNSTTRLKRLESVNPLRLFQSERSGFLYPRRYQSIRLMPDTASK